MKKNYLFFMFVYLAIFMTSCVKEGPEGPAGEDGKDGNANVKTEIIKVYNYDWDYNNSSYLAVKAPGILTEGIVDKGSVHLYLEVGEKKWVALPFNDIVFGFGVNDLAIWTQSENLTNTTSIFKLVVIDGNLNGMATLDFTNYIEVKEYFKLKD